MFYRPKPQITWLDAVKYNNFAYNKRNFFGKTAEKPCGKVDSNCFRIKTSQDYIKINPKGSIQLSRRSSPTAFLISHLQHTKG